MVDTGLINIKKRKQLNCRIQWERKSPDTAFALISGFQINRLQMKLHNVRIEYHGQDIFIKGISEKGIPIFILRKSSHLKRIYKEYLRTRPANLWVQGIFRYLPERAWSDIPNRPLHIYRDDKPICQEKKHNV
jgi:hypothetical protein